MDKNSFWKPNESDLARYVSPEFEKLLDEYWKKKIQAHAVGHNLITAFPNLLDHEASEEERRALVPLAVFCHDCRILLGLVPMSYEQAFTLQYIADRSQRDREGPSQQRIYK